jgi:hypothetical protein
MNPTFYMIDFPEGTRWGMRDGKVLKGAYQWAPLSAQDVSPRNLKAAGMEKFLKDLGKALDSFEVVSRQETWMAGGDLVSGPTLWVQFEVDGARRMDSVSVLAQWGDFAGAEGIKSYLKQVFGLE